MTHTGLRRGLPLHVLERVDLYQRVRFLGLHRDLFS